MTCKLYKEALSETAARGAAPRGALRAHLETCAICHSAFANKQFVFAAIDAGIRKTASAEISPSFLPRIRARLSEAEAASCAEMPKPKWIFASTLAALSAALLFAIMLPTWRSKVTQNRGAPLQMKTLQAAQKEIGTQFAPASLPPVQSAPRFRGHTTNKARRPGTRRQPEVLVPAEEREAFYRFVSAMEQRKEVAVALTRPIAKRSEEALTVEPLKIAELAMQPLDGHAELSRPPGDAQ